jgi:hypothetical protein
MPPVFVPALVCQAHGFPNHLLVILDTTFQTANPTHHVGELRSSGLVVTGALTTRPDLLRGPGHILKHVQQMIILAHLATRFSRAIVSRTTQLGHDFE